MRVVQIRMWKYETLNLNYTYQLNWNIYTWRNIMHVLSVTISKCIVVQVDIYTDVCVQMTLTEMYSGE